MAVAIKPLIEVDVAPVGKRPAVAKGSPLHPGARTDATDKAINNVATRWRIRTSEDVLP